MTATPRYGTFPYHLSTALAVLDQTVIGDTTIVAIQTSPRRYAVIWTDDGVTAGSLLGIRTERSARKDFAWWCELIRADADAEGEAMVVSAADRAQAREEEAANDREAAIDADLDRYVAMLADEAA